MDEALSAQAKWMAPTRQSEVDCGLLTLRPTQGHCPRETPDSISDPVGTFWPRHHARGSGKAEGSEPESWFSTWTSFHWGVSLWGIRKYTEGVPGVGWSEDPRRLYLKWDLEVPALQRSQRGEVQADEQDEQRPWNGWRVSREEMEEQKKGQRDWSRRKNGIETQTKKTNVWISRGKERGGMNWETGIDIYMLLWSI